MTATLHPTRQLHAVPLADIKIDRERFRDATGDMEGLAASLLRFGQLEPIILERNNELIAGFRRYTAAGMNGWTHIDALYQDEIDELTAREIELEENIQREQMTWQERAKALAEIDKIKRDRDPNWTQQQTAQVAGGKTSQRDVSEAVKVAKMMEIFPEIKEAKSLNQAKSWLEQKAKNVLRTHEVKTKVIDYGAIEEKIWLGDSRELIKRVPDESINHIVTDPPFGIDYDKRKVGTDGSLTDYKDDAETYRSLLGMAPDMYRILKPDSFCIWFFGMSWYEDAKAAFRDAGFTVDELPIIWDRSEGRCHTNRPDRYMTRAYDVALHMFKGEPNLVKRNQPNIIRIKPVENSEREALVERPIELYEELIERVSVPGESILDLFAGSGSCPAAAARKKRDYLAFEQNPERRAIAIKKVKANTPG